MFAFLAEHRCELFPDSFTADLFLSRTRPAVAAGGPGGAPQSVFVLKELYDLSDARTADALRYDLRWKVAQVVPGADAVIAVACRLDYSRPGKPGIDWDDPAARQQLVSDLVNDELAVWMSWPTRMRRPGMRRRPARWGCWRWWPGRTWSRPSALTGRAGGGGSRGKWPRTG